MSIYSDHDIEKFIADYGIADNRWALYNFAKHYGVSPGDIDRVRKWDRGTMDRWILQERLHGLAGSAVGGFPPAVSHLDDGQVQRLFYLRNAAENPHAMYALGRQFGLTALQIDRAMGYAPGTTAFWTEQQGLEPLRTPEKVA